MGKASEGVVILLPSWTQNTGMRKEWDGQWTEYGLMLEVSHNVL